MRFSLVGFIVGAICALILYIVGTRLVEFEEEELVFGLGAFLLWFVLTTNWPAGGFRVTR
jgi:hypothetical protein